MDKVVGGEWKVRGRRWRHKEGGGFNEKRRNSFSYRGGEEILGKHWER
jgi:hypothetical protein